MPSIPVTISRPRRYLIWGVERVLERIGKSMLSSQYIIESCCVICDAKGWALEDVSFFLATCGCPWVVPCGRRHEKSRRPRVIGLVERSDTPGDT